MLYFSGRDGTSAVAALCPEFEILAVNRLDDHAGACPAVVGDSLLLRGLQNLYCVGVEEESSPQWIGGWAEPYASPMQEASATRAAPDSSAAPGAPGCVRVRGLTRRFGETLALAPLDLDLGPGAVTGLLGPNGSGKSTFLRTLIGLVPKDAGEAWLDGVRLEGDGTAIRQRCTFAPGELAFYGHLRAIDQLDWLTEGRTREGRQRARDIADDLGLPLRARVRSFSHGMKRQLLFAGAMGPRVAVRVLDEITEGLDPSKRGSVLELLREDAASGTTILLSSHHLPEVQRVCDRMVFLADGKKLSDENAEDIRLQARRTLRLCFQDSAQAREFEEHARVPGILTVQRQEAELVMQLESEDPRAALVRVLGSSAAPAPLRIEYGELSLENLYRDLYGEDAC